MLPQYIGKIEYCYSNSTAMLLQSIGETINPSLIEVMTGMGIGAHMPPSGLLFFDCSEPDFGISRALKNLGFSFTEASSDDPTKASFDTLRELLKNGPVVLGPLEFAKLVYNPAHVDAGDADHYVLAYDMDNEFVYLHDPWGFPCTRISYADLEKAWRAEAIGYKRGYFRYWCNPKRIEQPSNDQLYERVLATCKQVYTQDETRTKANGRLVGSDAITSLANSIRQKPLEKWQIDFFIQFCFPLSAKRSLDYASYFKERDKKLSEIKYKQAALFGLAGNYTVEANWPNLSDVLLQLADKEDIFRSTLLG